MAKTLIVYYSRKGENYVGGIIENLAKGNTKIVAEMIEQAVGGDLFEVDTVKAYAANYRECTVEAQEELKNNARPELKAYIDSIAEYDTIFVGYPNWWGTMPMAMFTFLERYDFAGKRIIPFCTNEGSGMGISEKDIKRICQGAVVEKGLAIRGSEAGKASERVAVWAKSVM